MISVQYINSTNSKKGVALKEMRVLLNVSNTLNYKELCFTKLNTELMHTSCHRMNSKKFKLVIYM